MDDGLCSAPPGYLRGDLMYIFQIVSTEDRAEVSVFKVCRRMGRDLGHGDAWLELQRDFVRTVFFFFPVRR